MTIHGLPPDVVLVTGNPGKVLEARRICGARLAAIEIDLPEIQSLDVDEVLRAKADAAARIARRPVIVEETSLELAALNGFPGPLVKWMLVAVRAEGIARTALALGDPRAAARCRLMLRDGDRTTTAEGVTEGRLVLPARGDAGFGWDPVFEPEDRGLTYAELGAEVKDEIGHRGRAWRALLARLNV